MRFSIWPSSAQSWSDILATARHAESTGWEGIWLADHFMPNAADVSGPMHECTAGLAGLAASTERMRIGSIVYGNTYRHPAVLAKTMATIDHISGGRVVFGLGAGWQENEHTAYGIEFSTVGGRLDRLEEACKVVKGLFGDERTTFAGKHYQLTDAPLEPKPVGSMPLLVGGGGEKRTMRIAAQYADEWNVWGTPDVLEAKGKVLDDHCAALGRDPKTIARSTQALLFMSEDEAWVAQRREVQTPMPKLVGTPSEVVDVLHAYEAAGVDEFLVPDFTLGPLDRKLATMDLFMEKVVSAFR